MGRQLLLPGWSRKTSVWRRKLLRKPHAANLSRKNSSGFARARKAVKSKGKARLARFEELNNVEYQKRNETNELFIPPGPRLGDKVLEVSHLRKSYGDRVLIDDLSFSVPKGAIVGIIGPNGAGKSTLFRMMSGQEQPDSGTITLG